MVRDMGGDATDHAASLGIHRITLPTPFQIGTVHAYLLEGAAPALIDCGPNAATALNALEAALATHGLRLGDVPTIVATHEHIDHCGLAGPIAARTGADVACLDLLAPTLETWFEYAVRNDDYAVELMLRHGVDAHVANALRAMADVYRHWGQPAPITRRLADGQTVRLAGRELAVRHRPGHSPSDTLLYDPRTRIAFGGDHLLADFASTAFLTIADGGDKKRPRPLLDYRASLRATREMDIDVVLPGHGPPIVDHRALIDDRLARQERRAARFLELLGDQALSAHELATAQWGAVAITQAFTTLSEVLGHLDLLLEAGAIVEHADGPVTRFRSA